MASVGGVVTQPMPQPRDEPLIAATELPVEVFGQLTVQVPSREHVTRRECGRKACAGFQKIQGAVRAEQVMRGGRPG